MTLKLSRYQLIRLKTAADTHAQNMRKLAAQGSPAAARVSSELDAITTILANAMKTMDQRGYATIEVRECLTTP